MTAIVRSRSASATPANAAQSSIVPDALTVRMQYANALSKAGAVLPACYQNNPGACLALMSWAEAHGKDIVTAGNGVYTTSDGRLLVSAEMRVQLANDAGYDMIDVTPEDRRREECTIEVRTPAGETHRLTVRLADIDDSVKGPTPKGKPSAWMVNPEDMLLRTAQRRADKRFCRSAAVVIDGGNDWEDAEPMDPVDIIANNTGTDHDPVDIAEAEVVDPEPVPYDGNADPDPTPEDDLAAPPITEEDLRAAGKVGDILRAAKKHGSDEGVALVADVAADQELAKAVLADLKS